MKRLQESGDERWLFQGMALLDGVQREVEPPGQVILLLHGFNERGRRIFRKLLSSLPPDAYVIAPNGPFPLPRQKEDRVDFGYAWYFYDRHRAQYLINQDLAINWLKNLLVYKGLDSVPLSIIGFSQGGYLAPMLGQQLPQTKLVIGIGCEFRPHLIKGHVDFELHAIHGKDDEIISPDSALRDLQALKERKIVCGWSLLSQTGHEINSHVADSVREILEQYGKRSL